MKTVITTTELEALIAVNARRIEIVNWLNEQADAFGMFAVEAYMDGDNERGDYYAGVSAMMGSKARKVANRRETCDQHINLIWLGEIEFVEQF